MVDGEWMREIENSKYFNIIYLQQNTNQPFVDKKRNGKGKGHVLLQLHVITSAHEKAIFYWVSLSFIYRTCKIFHAEILLVVFHEEFCFVYLLMY